MATDSTVVLPLFDKEPKRRNRKRNVPGDIGLALRLLVAQCIAQGLKPDAAMPEAEVRQNKETGEWASHDKWPAMALEGLGAFYKLSAQKYVAALGLTDEQSGIVSRTVADAIAKLEAADDLAASRERERLDALEAERKAKAAKPEAEADAPKAEIVQPEAEAAKPEAAKREPVAARASKHS